MESGNQQAQLDFSEVYCLHADAVFRFCLSQVHERTAAEDVAADVFAAAFAAYSRSRPARDGLRPWLFSIARNATIDQRRRAHTRHLLLGALRSSRVQSADVESAAAIRQDLREVLAIVGTLRRRDQQLIGLRAAAALSYAEIGGVMGINENTARMATHRAMARVRTAMERNGE